MCALHIIWACDDNRILAKIERKKKKSTIRHDFMYAAQAIDNFLYNFKCYVSKFVVLSYKRHLSREIFSQPLLQLHGRLESMLCLSLSRPII